LWRIRELGHEVGLHFAAGEHQGEHVAARIKQDAELLAHAVGAPVRVFSFHNPTESDAFTIDVPGLVNAYADRFFAEAHYLSESNMRWRHDSPVEVLPSRQHRVIQILVHPLTYRDAFESDRDVLLWFIRDVTRRLVDANVRQNRVLRAEGLSLAEVAAYLVEGDAEP
jgi:hypothetical protein